MTEMEVDGGGGWVGGCKGMHRGGAGVRGACY